MAKSELWPFLEVPLQEVALYTSYSVKPELSEIYTFVEGNSCLLNVLQNSNNLGVMFSLVPYKNKDVIHLAHTPSSPFKNFANSFLKLLQGAENATKLASNVDILKNKV